VGAALDAADPEHAQLSDARTTAGRRPKTRTFGGDARPAVNYGDVDDARSGTERELRTRGTRR